MLMATMTKKELTDRIADSMKMRRVLVKDVIQRFLDEIVVELTRGNRLEFRDFGVFEIRNRKPRMAQNPRTLERVPVPSKTTVKFKVGRQMRDRVQKSATSHRGGKAERKSESAAAPPVSPPSA
jgi:integration host factor subunit beta